MHDPRHPIPRPMPKPAAGGGLVDPLMELSHKEAAAHAQKPLDRVRLDDDEPIALVDDEDAQPTKPGSPSIKPGDSLGGSRIKSLEIDRVKVVETFKRPTNRTGTGACRVRSFHCKYSDEGLRYLDNAINTWLDEHPDVEVKFVTPTVMTFEGKIREPALVLNVWY
jgi:hypothetical protein